MGTNYYLQYKNKKEIHLGKTVMKDFGSTAFYIDTSHKTYRDSKELIVYLSKVAASGDYLIRDEYNKHHTVAEFLTKTLFNARLYTYTHVPYIDRDTYGSYREGDENSMVDRLGYKCINVNFC